MLYWKQWHWKLKPIIRFLEKVLEAEAEASDL